MNVEYISFKSRQERVEYVASKFHSLLTGSILDVGCDQAVLRTLLPGSTYTGIDITGCPDLPVNLETTGTLPFEDEAFDCVVCTDVLEHLDNLHQMFEEIVRVSRKHILVSLPNNWANARQPIAKGHGSFSHYGLPAAKPQDRHKWFFNISEAKAFIEENARQHSLFIPDMFITEKARPLVVRFVRRLFAGTQERYFNRYSHTLWVVLAKR